MILLDVANTNEVARISLRRNYTFHFGMIDYLQNKLWVSKTILIAQTIFH